MAKTIEVTPDLLDSAAGKIDSLAADYQSQYNNLYSETSAMASTWSGKDNVAYINQIEGYKDDFKAMHKLMLDYSDFLKKSAKSYRDTQNTVVAEAKKLVN